MILNDVAQSFPSIFPYITKTTRISVAEDNRHAVGRVPSRGAGGQSNSVNSPESSDHGDCKMVFIITNAERCLRPGAHPLHDKKGEKVSSAITLQR